MRRRIISELLASELRDNVDARELQPDASYVMPVRAAGEESFSAQKYFMALASARATAAAAPVPVPAPLPPASPSPVT